MELTVEALAALGPLGPLVGTWEGASGDDTAPGDDRGVEKNAYRERLTFTPIGRVDNHEQILYGVQYAKRAWRLGAADSFHEEVGYMLYDRDRNQVIKAFLIPRGVSVLAGGTVESAAHSFKLTATLGSPTYGILSNQFLDVEFKTTAYEVTYTVDGDSLRTEELTVLQLKGKPAPFEHRDANTLVRIPG